MPPADHVPTPPVLAAPLFDLAELPQAGNGMDLRAVKPRCQDERAGEIVVCAPSSEKDAYSRYRTTSSARRACPARRCR